MADPNDKGADQKDQQLDKETDKSKETEIDVETLRAENERLKKEAELKDNDIKGKDRKLTEFQKALNATKTEEERKRIEDEERRKNILAKYSKLAVKTVGLDESFSDLITGIDEEEIDSKIETFQKIKATIEEPHIKQIKTLQDALKSAEEEIKTLKASGPTPGSGQNTSGAKMSLGDIEKLPTHEERIKALKENGYR